MASYVNKKERAFREGHELLPRRSEGRMKTYPSATDARAWCDVTEDRRQHIIELIRQDISKVRVESAASSRQPAQQIRGKSIAFVCKRASAWGSTCPSK